MATTDLTFRVEIEEHDTIGEYVTARVYLGNVELHEEAFVDPPSHEVVLSTTVDEFAAKLEKLLRVVS